jgi:lysophospholipase L1-like esterase
MRILFIGNSFTGRNDLPDLLREMAASAPQPGTIVTEQVLANGASLRQHWNAGVAAEKIRAGGWDFVVLQEQSTLPIKNANRFHENVRLFDQEIQEHGARTVLYLTWARQQAPETQAALTQATKAIATELGALTAPVGDVWKTVLEEEPAWTLYDKDGSHPSRLGSYLAACVLYATLFPGNPVGPGAAERLQVSPHQAAALQQAAGIAA